MNRRSSKTRGNDMEVESESDMTMDGDISVASRARKLSDETLTLINGGADYSFDTSRGRTTIEDIDAKTEDDWTEIFSEIYSLDGHRALQDVFFGLVKHTDVNVDVIGTAYRNVVLKNKS